MAGRPAAVDRARAPASLIPVPPHALTRRRALALGAAAGAGALLRARVPPALAGPADSFSMDVVPAHPGRVVVAPRRFQVVGAHAHGVEIRTRTRSGRWGEWRPRRAAGAHGPDAQRSGGASDPVWVGDADELQLRGARRGLRLNFVAVPPGARTRVHAARAHSAQGGAPPMIMRDQWGPGFKARVAPVYGEVQMAFVHHTVNVNDYAPQDSAAIVLGIARYHRDHNGWNDIGYNFLVDKYGQLFEGRGGGIEEAVIGAQSEGWNRLSTGVANIGTYSAVPQTPQAIATISRLLAWKLTLHGVPCRGHVLLTSGGGASNRYRYGAQVRMKRISGHRDGCTTDCPGNQLYAQLPLIRTKAATLAGPVAAALRLTCSSGEPDVAYGDDAVFSGTAASAGDGTPAAGIDVSLQRGDAGGDWTTVAHATTAADGTWSARVPWRRGGRVRARVGATVSPSTAVGVIALLEARTLTTRVRAGASATLTGSVRPSSPVRVLVEQRDRRGRWRRVREITLKVRHQRFTAHVRLPSAGLYRLTPRIGPLARPVAAPALYVRAERRVPALPLSGGTPAA